MASRCISPFCSHGTEEKELCSGYLYKSPPENQIRLQKSWKRRFFILKNSKASFQLEYYKNKEKTKTEPLGAIALSQVSLMLLRPESHPMWKWVHQNFRCSATCVLFMKVADRDYFFIGEDSWEVEKWFRALFDALNHRPHRLLDPEDSGRIKEISEPPLSLNMDKGAEWKLEIDISQESIYSFVKKPK
ncbi:pleckstrin homology domain-containing family S member 1-like [Hoplias malabaricus]|uniref:pleckstrin homology domain-containing family S member 1-like n=1 Tax=Hoplias malabaricus TaxID=27720 RepID=UPI0034626B55